MNLPSFLGRTFNVSLGKYTLSPTYFYAVVIVFLLFLLVLTLAQVRRHFLNWSLKGGIFGIALGFFLALILEGFMVIGGKTVVTEVLGWKNAPKPIITALEAGRNRLVDVLGVTDEIQTSEASQPPGTQIIELYQSLPPALQEEVRYEICTQ
jgi:hypothetical protein